MSEVISEAVTWEDPVYEAIDSETTILETTAFIEPLTDTSESIRSITEQVDMVSTSVVDFPQQAVVQKVWDTVAGGWILWETEAMDIDGLSYPGPGTWGAQTSDYRVQNIKFTRVQS